MKEVIGKTLKSQNCLPRKLVIDKVEIIDQKQTENEFNAFFRNVGPQLAINIPNPCRPFERFLIKFYKKISSIPLSINELKETFSLLKNCPYSELFWSAFSRTRTEYGEVRCISPYSVRMLGNEIRTRITPIRTLFTKCFLLKLNKMLR